jgi:hypothetical protein
MKELSKKPEEGDRDFHPVEESFDSTIDMLLRFIDLISKGDWRIDKKPQHKMLQAVRTDGGVLIQGWIE